MDNQKPKSLKGSAKTKAEGALDYVMEHPGRVLVGGAVVGLGSFLLYRFVKKMINNAQQTNTEKKLDDSPEVRQASILRNAMNPSGISWMMSFDNTSTDKVLETAKSITKLDDVMTSYKKLYSSDLLEDLQSELNTEEYQKFTSIIESNAGKKGAAPTTYAKKNQMVVAKKAIRVRKTADATYTDGMFQTDSENNILFTTKPGDFIGYATGKQEFDSKNNVKFIQVGYIVKKDGIPESLKKFAGKSFTMWVSSNKDYVDMFDFFAPMYTQYPNTKTATAYKKPLNFYDGVKGLPARAVVSIANTKVLNEKMQFLCNVEKQVLLGEYTGSLNTGKRKFIKFRTVDYTERWADSTTIKIIEK